jgi:Zn-dependent protease/CBS domain-containing protein
MFGKGLRIFSFLGIAVRVDWSWLIIAALVTWSLAVGLFPHQIAGLPEAFYWWMGIAGAMGLFLSIVLHEISHALVARAYGLPIKGITLFIFGGVAEMEEEPRSARAEFFMAGAGPLTSIVLAALSYGLYVLSDLLVWPLPVIGVLWYMAMINALLAVFNLIPGFPLDGGRLLRAVLWHWKGDLRRATRIASRIGAGFGTLLMVLGVARFLLSDWLGGIWSFLIGVFLRSAARSSYEQLLIRQSLEGTPIKQFMNPHPVTVTPDMPVDRLVEEYVLRYHHKMLPIVEDGRLVGCVTMQQIKSAPREQWSALTVRDIAKTCAAANTVSPETDALKVLSLMNRTHVSRVMVAEDGRLVGILSLRDLLRFMAIRMELEDGASVDLSSAGLPGKGESRQG